MTDHSWEIRRLRRFKALFVELDRDQADEHMQCVWWTGLCPTAKRARRYSSGAKLINTRMPTGSLDRPNCDETAYFVRSNVVVKTSLNACERPPRRSSKTRSPSCLRPHDRAAASVSASCRP